MTTLKASWTSGGQPIVVTTEVGPNDDFDAKVADHILAVRNARAANPPD